MNIRTFCLGGALVAAVAVGTVFLLRDQVAAVGRGPRTVRSTPSLRAEARSVGSEPTQAPPVTRPSVSSPTREDQLRELARTQARADIAGAIAWLRTLAPADAAVAIEMIFAEIGRDDPAGAIALGQALGYGTTDGRLEHVVQLWTETEPVAAVAWVSAQPAGADRDRLLARVALVRVRDDPAEAARLLEAMADGATRDAAIAATIARLRIYDPAKADTWQALLADD